MLWFRAKHFNTACIDTVNVVAFTDRMVTIEYENGSTLQVSRKQDTAAYFPTWIEAKNHLLQVMREKLARAEKTVETAKHELRVIINYPDSYPQNS